jgi:hypothetical protein
VDNDLGALTPRTIGGLFVLLAAIIALGEHQDAVALVAGAAAIIMLEDRVGLMQTDTIKLIATYALAFIVVVGGGAILFVTRLDPPDSLSAQYGLLISGFIGGALTWAFTKESATQATRAAAAATREAHGGPPDGNT